MRFFNGVVAALLVLVSSAAAASPGRIVVRTALNQTSTEPGTKALPFTTSVYSQAAGLAQQTYCVNSKAGVVVGDSTLLYTYGDGINIQRANIYYSKSLGITLAYQGTNTSSLASDLYDVVFVSTLPDSRLGLPVGSTVDLGFQSAWQASYSDVLKGLVKAKARYPKSKLTVVGHSLGASQALLAGLALQKLYGVDKVVTCMCYFEVTLMEIRLISFSFVYCSWSTSSR